MGVGASMAVFLCAVWAFQAEDSIVAPFLVELAALIPWQLRRFCPNGRRVGLAMAVAPVSAALFIALWPSLRMSSTSRIGWIALSFVASAAEATAATADARWARSLLPDQLWPAGERICRYGANVLGIVAPLLAAALSSLLPAGMAVLISGLMMSAGALGSWVVAHTGGVELSSVLDQRNGLSGIPSEALAVHLHMNLTLAATHGALLAPMLLSRATVGALAWTIAWFFAGMSLGQFLNPLGGFFRDAGRGYVRLSIAALLVLTVLFGMSRTGWQWNACAALGGALMAASWGCLERLDEGRGGGMIEDILRTPGLILGMLCGSLLEWFMARSGAAQAVCARLTGFGEGCGMAMAFIALGALDVALLYALLRAIRRSDDN